MTTRDLSLELHLESAAAAPKEEAAQEVRLCAFKVGRDEMVLDIMRIREILRPVPLTPVPRAPVGIVGMLNLRGEVIPVLDLRIRFGLPPDEDNPQRRMMVVLDRHRFWGLSVDAVTEVVRVPKNAIRPGHDIFSGEAQEVFSGVVQHKGRLLLMLNLHRLMMRDRPLSDDLLASAPLLPGGRS